MQVVNKPEKAASSRIICPTTFRKQLFHRRGLWRTLFFDILGMSWVLVKAAHSTNLGLSEALRTTLADALYRPKLSTI